MADDGTARKVDAAPARHVRRSNEGGRVVSMEVGAGRSAMSSLDDTMRVEAGDEGYPGASNDESAQMHLDCMAEAIAKLSPSFQENKRSVAAKLKAAVEKL